MGGTDGFGTQLKRGDGGGPEVFSAIANVKTFKGPGLKREVYDSTTHDSPNGWRTKAGGLKDAGELELEINFRPASQSALTADFEDAQPRNYQLVFPDGSTWACPMVLSEFTPSAPVDGLITASAKFALSGKPTIT